MPNLREISVSFSLNIVSLIGVFAVCAWWSYSIKNFSSAAYGEALKILIFSAAFPKVSDFVSTASFWLKMVLSVDVASPKDLANSVLIHEKCFDFLIMLYLSVIENHFQFVVISH